MAVEVITTDDLENFRIRLLKDIEKMIHSKQPRKWLKSNEVMEILGISEVTLQTFRNKGIIPFRKLGGACYYNAQELDDAISKL